MAHLCVDIGDKLDLHDVLEHSPGRIELMADEGSASWAQALIVQGHLNWRNGRVGLGGIQLKTLLLNLKGINVRGLKVMMEGRLRGLSLIVRRQPKLNMVYFVTRVVLVLGVN